MESERKIERGREGRRGRERERCSFTLLYSLVSMVGGQHKIRPLWRHYFTGCAGLLYVIDSADKNRFEESREELSWIVEDQEMKGKKHDAISCSTVLPTNMKVLLG